MAHLRGLVVACLLLLSVSIAAAFEFKVGGSGEWKVPEHNAQSYNQWAENHRFRVGDSIVFSYQAGQDSVLLVDMRAYNSCDTSSRIDAFSDGKTVFTFTRSGPFYFISGNAANCNKNEKLIVVVLAERTTAAAPAASPSPSPSPPNPYAWTPPPPSGAEMAPTTSPPKSGASSKAVGVAGALGCAVGSFIYAAFV